MKEGLFPTTRLGDLIEENSKSRLKARDSVDVGRFVFFTSGVKTRFSDEHLCDGENLFLATGGSAHVNYYNGPAAYSTDCYSIRGQDYISTKFLYYFLLSQLAYINDSLFEGAALKHLQKRAFKEIPVPVPSRSLRDRIVTILDKAFAAIAAATANAEKNLANARELFESQLQALITQRNQGWTEKLLSEVSEVFGRGKSRHRPRNEPSLYGGPYPFIQTGDISQADHWLNQYSQTYSETGLAQSRLWPRGTICIAIVGATVGETAILDFEACFPDSVIGIVVNKEMAENEYVEYVLQVFKSHLKEKGKGTARDNINVGTFEDQRFPFPPLKQQKKIVVTLNRLREDTQDLAAICQRKLVAITELKQSILHKAFAGELTTGPEKVFNRTPPAGAV